MFTRGHGATSTSKEAAQLRAGGHVPVQIDKAGLKGMGRLPVCVGDYAYHCHVDACFPSLWPVSQVLKAAPFLFVAGPAYYVWALLLLTVLTVS